MMIFRCVNCQCDFDAPALVHHASLTKTGCPGAGYILSACDWHRGDCPLNDPEYRLRVGGWSDRSRTCTPLYRLAAGKATREPGRQAEPFSTTWLTLSPAPQRAKLRAPRTPAALGGAR